MIHTLSTLRDEELRAFYSGTKIAIHNNRVAVRQTKKSTANYYTLMLRIDDNKADLRRAFAEAIKRGINL